MTPNQPNNKKCENCEVIEHGGIIMVDKYGNCTKCGKERFIVMSPSPNSNDWEERFDKQFGKAGPEMDSDSIGRKAGCDDCWVNIELREEVKLFIADVLSRLDQERVEKVRGMLGELHESGHAIRR